MHAAAVRGDGFAEVDAHVLAPARSEPWYGYATIDDADDWHLTRLLVTEPFEPLEALAGVGCPFLAIYGGLDVLVPAWRGAEETGRALRAAGNDDSTVVVFPGGDHRITDPVTGDFVPGYLDLLGDWAAARVE